MAGARAGCRYAGLLGHRSREERAIDDGLPRRIRRGISLYAGGIVLLSAITAPYRADAVENIVIGSSPVVATQVGDSVKARIQLLNVGQRSQQLPEQAVVSGGSCEMANMGDERGRTLPALQSSTVEVDFGKLGCFDDVSQLRVDVDGPVGATPPVTVMAPVLTPAPPWGALVIGSIVGLMLGAVTALVGLGKQRKIQNGFNGNVANRTANYNEVKDIINARMAILDGPELDWKDLPPQSFSWHDKVGNLASDWSFKDSWVSNLTVATTAFVALVTSTDVLSAVLPADPKSALSVMVVAGLLSAVMIALAITSTKLFGPSASEVSVGGLLVATTLCSAAVGLQVATIGLAAAYVFEPPRTHDLASLALTSPLGWISMASAGAVLVAVMAFITKSLREMLEHGVLDNVPVIPPDALESWQIWFDEQWERELAKQQILTTFRKWFTNEPTAPIAAPPRNVAFGSLETRYDPTSGLYYSAPRSAIM